MEQSGMPWVPVYSRNRDETGIIVDFETGIFYTTNTFVNQVGPFPAKVYDPTKYTAGYSLGKRSTLTLSMNSASSFKSRCHSRSCLNQVNRLSSASPTTFPSLYFQWAAMPSSAILCIS